MTGALCLLLLLAASSAAANCSPGTSDCSCSQMGGDSVELLCPRDFNREPALVVQASPGDYVKVQCKTAATEEGGEGGQFQLLKGAHLGGGKPFHFFTLKLCPLPRGPLRGLMDDIDVANTRVLQIQSHGNLSGVLRPEHLRGLWNVSQLNLNNNALRELHEDLFQEMSNLTWLDLKNNEIRLPRGIFRYVPRLEVLELGSNNLSSLEVGLFRNLTRLRLLNLWGNRLRNLSRALFTDIPQLESLDLNSNGLKTLAPDLFADLAQLKNVNLYGNDFVALPPSLLLANTKLEKIKLQHNRRSLETLPPGFLSNKPSMKEIHLSWCNLSRLPEDLIWSSDSISNLTLRGNLLTTLPGALFRDATRLRDLDLSRNRIRELPDSVFKPLVELRVLNLADNNLTFISRELFSSLTKLTDLRLERNQLSRIDPVGFQSLRSLESIDLSHNWLAHLAADYTDPTFGRHSLLHASVKLRRLNLADNQLSEIYSDWVVSMTHLSILNLSQNNFTQVTLEDLQFLSPRLTLDLSWNQIYRLVGLNGLEALALLKGPYSENNSVRVLLKGNPLACDCHAYNLVRYFNGELTPEVRYLVEFVSDGLYCNSPDDLSGMPIRNVDKRLLICDLEGEECPTPCSCYFRPWDRALLVDCSSRNLTSPPPSMPSDKPTLDLTNHTELDLSSNQLTELLPASLSQGYDRVTTFDLTDNQLSDINLVKLSKEMRVLRLAGNNLTRLDGRSLKFLQEAKHLKEVTLRKNPWTCDCETRYLLNFLQSSFKKVSDLGNVTCGRGDRKGSPLSKMSVSDLCPATPVVWALGVSIATLGLLLGGTAAFYYKYRSEVKVWLFARGLCTAWVTEAELDKGKKYDAFVSYSHKDEEFVAKELVRNLEESGPRRYKLCLHYRDWLVGDFIPAQITRSVEESRRTVVVLTPDFLESVWGRMEFRTAHAKALKEGRARVIVILKGDVGPIDKLDPELKAYLTMNTYVKWGDPWFWDKLRYALPHPQKKQQEEKPKKPFLASIPLLFRSKAEAPLSPDPEPLNTPPADVFIDPITQSLKDPKPAV